MVILSIEGNQYTYVGNSYMNKTNQPQCVEESINKIIENQELGKSPFEFSNVLSRAKGKNICSFFSDWNEKYETSKAGEELLFSLLWVMIDTNISVLKQVASSMRGRGMATLEVLPKLFILGFTSLFNHRSQASKKLK